MKQRIGWNQKHSSKQTRSKDYNMVNAIGYDEISGPIDETVCTLKASEAVHAVEHTRGTDSTEAEWIIPNMLPQGLTLLVGRPGVGKSRLALQLSQAITSGGQFLGREAEPGRVLYWAFEHDRCELQRHLQKDGRRSKISVDFWPTIPPEHAYGDSRLGYLHILDSLMKQEKYACIVLDPLVLTIAEWMHDTNIVVFLLTQIREMAHSHGCGVLVIDHYDDPRRYVDRMRSDLLGSLAGSVVADCVFGLYRYQSGGGAKLEVVGGDSNNHVLNLVWDTKSCQWHLQESRGQDERTEELVVDMEWNPRESRWHVPEGGRWQV